MTRLEKLLRLVETSPEDPLPHYAVALEYFNQERFDAAISAFERALGLDADFTAAYYHKARAEIRADRKDAARATLTAGLEVARRRGDRKTEREMGELFEAVR